MFSFSGENKYFCDLHVLVNRTTANQEKTGNFCRLRYYSSETCFWTAADYDFTWFGVAPYRVPMGLFQNPHVNIVLHYFDGLCKTSIAIFLFSVKYVAIEVLFENSNPKMAFDRQPLQKRTKELLDILVRPGKEERIGD